MWCYPKDCYSHSSTLLTVNLFRFRRYVKKQECTLFARTGTWFFPRISRRVTGPTLRSPTPTLSSTSDDLVLCSIPVALDLFSKFLCLMRYWHFVHFIFWIYQSWMKGILFRTLLVLEIVFYIMLRFADPAERWTGIFWSGFFRIYSSVVLVLRSFFLDGLLHIYSYQEKWWPHSYLWIKPTKQTDYSDSIRLLASSLMKTSLCSSVCCD